MRHEIALPANACIAGLTQALTAKALPGFSGVSAYGGTLAIEFPERLNALTDAEVATISEVIAINPASWDMPRQMRASLLLEADWRIERAEDKGEDTSNLRAYRQALRDITQQPDPRQVVWPMRPW